MLRRLHAGAAGGRHTGGPPGKLTAAARLAARGEFDTGDQTDDASGQAHAPDSDPDSAEARIARILAQAGLRAVDSTGADAAALAARRRLAPVPWFLWPCNLRVWELWSSLQTQWRVGLGGATGLDYASVWAVLDRCGLAPRRRHEVFDHIRSMERAVLDVWADRAAAERNARRG